MPGEIFIDTTPPIIPGTHVTAGDLLALAIDGHFTVPELPFDDLRDIEPEQIASVDALLHDGVPNDIKRRVWSLLSSVDQLILTSTVRVRLEEDFSRVLQPTLF